MLSPDEKARSGTFRFEADALAYRRTRAALRRLLGWYTDTAPEALTFRYSANGKPALAGTNTDLRFNVSHAGGRALIAVCTDAEIGIDLEAGCRPVNASDLSEAWFHRAECEAIRNAPAVERASTFLRCWTRKEAILKALGTGFGVALDTFAVPTDRCVQSRAVHLARAGHSIATVSSLDLDDDYIGAVAVCGATELLVQPLNFDPAATNGHLALPQTGDAAA